MIGDMLNNSAFQWKMGFNPDLSKKAQEIIFSCKSRRLTHPPFVFSNNNVSQTLFKNTWLSY